MKKAFIKFYTFCTIILLIVFGCACFTGCSWSEKDPMKQETFFESGYYLCYTDDGSLDTLFSCPTIIFGLTDEGKAQKQLVLPTVLDGKLIGWFGKRTENRPKWNYFESTNLERLYIPSDINIGSIYVLEKCYNLKEVIDVSCYSKRKFNVGKSTTVYVAEQVLQEKLKNNPDVNYQAANVEFRDTIVRDTIWTLMYDNKGIFWLDNVQPGELITLPPRFPKSETAEFLGWCIDEDCEIFWDFDKDLMPEDGKLILYPKYK